MKKQRIENLFLIALLVIVCAGPAFVTSHHLLNLFKLISFSGWLFILFGGIVLIMIYLGY